MSELNAFDITVAEEGYCEGSVKYRRAVYDKSEVDKVIAELRAQIVQADTGYDKLAETCREIQGGKMMICDLCKKNVPRKSLGKE